MTETNIVIVGAGAAGLAAARELQHLQQDYLLIDASHRIGGRAYTEDVGPGMPFDLGAHWIMAPSVNPLMPIAAKLRARLETSSEHFTAARYFSDGHWLENDAQQSFSQFWDGQFAALEQAYKRGVDCSVYDVIDNDHTWSPYFHMFFAQDFTRDVDQASVHDAMNYIRQEEDIAVASGLGHLLQSYGEGIHVTLNSAVRSIDYSGATITLDTAKGRIRANKLILTVSTGVLAAQQISFNPPLPDWKQEAIAGLPLGSCTRIALTFDKPVLQELPNEFTVDSDDDGPIHFRNRPFDYDYVEIAVGGRLASWMEKIGEKTTLKFVMTKLRSAAGTDIPDPVRTTVSAWDGDPWTRGAYSCARPEQAQQRAELARCIDERIFFAGEATSTDYYASVHGACLTGQSAARDVTSLIRPVICDV